MVSPYNTRGKPGTSVLRITRWNCVLVLAAGLVVQKDTVIDEFRVRPEGTLRVAPTLNPCIGRVGPLASNLQAQIKYPRYHVLARGHEFRSCSQRVSTTRLS